MSEARPSWRSKPRDRERNEGESGRDVNNQCALSSFEMRKKLLDHPNRPAQVDVDLARYIFRIAVFIELQVAHDPGVVDELTELGHSLGAAFCGVWMWAEQHRPGHNRRPQKLS